MKKHHTLIAVGLALCVLSPVIAGIHFAGGSLLLSGVVEWCYARQ